jgi:hypothetical protein
MPALGACGLSGALIFTMDSAVLGLAPSGCGCCAVSAFFDQNFALSKAIGSRAFAPPLEALAGVWSNGIPLGCPFYCKFRPTLQVARDQSHREI